jgi:hypothetical protein
MTRFYWNGSFRGRIVLLRVGRVRTPNQHVAALIIQSFNEPEIPDFMHGPYARWRLWLAENPLPEKTNQMDLP